MYAYLLEIDEELKFFITTMPKNKVEELHKQVYNTDFNIVWMTRNISQFTKEFILNYLEQDNDDGFYQSLDGVDLEEFKNIIENVNNGLVSFKSFFNGIIKEDLGGLTFNGNNKINLKSPIKSSDITDIIGISTRNGDPLGKNLSLRKVPSIWNTPSSLVEKVKKEAKL